MTVLRGWEPRRWQLTRTQPLALQLAADARLSATDHLDDQAWELTLGDGTSSALMLQTRYGGRVGLASIVPMWWVDKRSIYQAQAYAAQPTVMAFAPGYLEVHAKITPRLLLKAEYWVIDSHAVGGRFTLKNTAPTSVDVRLDLIAFAAAGGAEIKPKAAARVVGEQGLSFGIIRDIAPILILKGAKPETTTTAKLIVSFSIKAGGSVSLRWIHAALASSTEGFALAEQLLKLNWTRSITQITRAASALPDVQTGDHDSDAVIAFGAQQLVQSILRPTMSLPHESFVGARQPERGWSARGDGTDAPRSWSGQNPTLAYLTALGMASIDPAIAQGIVRNYLAVQQRDGWIDWRPGLAGQKSGMLCLPILARMAWGVFQYTEDEAFLRETFPGLLKFFGRWIKRDLDVDGDMIPEWSSESQTGYPYMPTFSAGLNEGQHADIRLIESPDLAAYLLSEANSLSAIAYYLHDTANEQKLSRIVETFKAALDSLWTGDRYTYRDRDSHITAKTVPLLDGGRADEEHDIAVRLDPPNRVIVRVVGGVEHVPAVAVTIEGLDQAGETVREVIPAARFTWSTGQGVTTSHILFSQVDRIRAEGLSRVYRLSASTVDTTRLDITGLLPIWSVGITPDRAAALVRQITDAAHFWLPNGVTMISARDGLFNAVKMGEGGGIWSYWVTMIGEGLIEYGYIREATELVKKLLAIQTRVLASQGAFYEFYHTEQPQGLGERGHSAGIVPLHLLMRVLGVRVISSRKVWTGGIFAWGAPITFTQHGVIVERSSAGTRIQFPSGKVVKLDADAPMQAVVDTPPAPVSSPAVPSTPPNPV